MVVMASDLTGCLLVLLVQSWPLVSMEKGLVTRGSEPSGTRVLGTLPGSPLDMTAEGMGFMWE